MQAAWNMEDIKLEIEVEGSEPYVVTTDSDLDDQRFISGASSNASENNSSNPFGICGNRSYNFEIVDLDDYLSPTNEKSPYYNKIRTGSKVRVFILDTETDEWVPDGTYYITYIGGGFSDGFHDVVTLTCQDKMDNIGSKANPKIPCLRNITVKDFVTILLGDDTGWEIDDDIGSKVLTYGITVGDKVRDTLNALVQYLQARITINRDNVLTIKNAVKVYGNEYTLTPDLVQSISNSYNSAADYSKIIVNYHIDGRKVIDVLLNDNGYTFKKGTNEPINGIKFRDKALSIHSISIKYNRHLFDSVLRLDSYEGYQDGIENLVASVAGDNIDSCTIYVEGASIDKSTRTEEKVLYQSEINGTVINIDIKYVIKQSEVNQLIKNLTGLLEKMTRQIVLKTNATPHINIGDRIILEDDDFTDTYKGTYRVIKYNTTHGEGYNNVLTLIKE